MAKSALETRLIHGDRAFNPTSSVAPPIFQTANFRSDSAADFAERADHPRHPQFYTRFGNPTLAHVESILADLEGAEAALVAASGMSAISTSILGGALGPFDAWLVLRGLRTLALRVERHNQNALKLAEFLEGHTAVARVHYPGLPSHPQHELARRQMSGFGGTLSFEVKGGYAAAEQCLDALRLASVAASLGSVETLAVHAAANFLHYMTPHEAERIGIAPGLIRVSVGLEHIDDLMADFDRALA